MKVRIFYTAQETMRKPQRLKLHTKMVAIAEVMAVEFNKEFPKGIK